jgi:hypothetical protein
VISFSNFSNLKVSVNVKNLMNDFGKVETATMQIVQYL